MCRHIVLDVMNQPFFLIINHRSGSAIESTTGDQGVADRHYVSYVFKGWVLTLFLCFPCVLAANSSLNVGNISKSFLFLFLSGR